MVEPTPISILERILNFFTKTKRRTHRSIIGAIILIIGLSLMIVHSQNQLLTANDELTKLNKQIDTTQTNNDNLHQNVAELLSANRIQKIAQQNDMHLNNDQIASIRSAKLK